MDGGKKEDRQEDLSCELLLDNVSPVSFLSRWTCKINYPEDLEKAVLEILTGMIFSFQ